MQRWTVLDVYDVLAPGRARKVRSVGPVQVEHETAELAKQRLYAQYPAARIVHWQWDATERRWRRLV